jgi:hypothetical protein
MPERGLTKKDLSTPAVEERKFSYSGFEMQFAVGKIETK